MADEVSDDGEEPSDEDDDEEGLSRGKAKGFTLVFDVVRRFAQPLGIELSKWEGRVIETKKEVHCAIWVFGRNFEITDCHIGWVIELDR